MKPIYMDYQATTPVDPRVVDMMLPYLTEHFGNASSRTHEYGWTARRAVDRARQQMADLIGARPKEIIFTSGATESNNLALKGTMAANRFRGDHLITVVTEHKAVLDSCTTLEREGYRVTRLPVGQDGRVDIQDVERAITDKTVLISVMTANNEIGVVQPIAEIGTLARSRQVLFHSDAAQAAGKIPFPVNDLHVDLASFSGHKFYAPKGVGVLYVRRRDPKVALIPMQDGGGHEGGFRSGTLNVPGIVGLGKAAEICAAEGENEARRILSLRDRLLEGLTARVSDLRVNGSMTHRLPHNLHVSFAGVEGHELLLALTDVAVSSGAACTSANPEPPYVLKALGIDDDLARASIRFGLGRFNTVEEVDYVVDRVADVVEGLRRSSVQRSVGSAIAL